MIAEMCVHDEAKYYSSLSNLGARVLSAAIPSSKRGWQVVFKHIGSTILLLSWLSSFIAIGLFPGQSEAWEEIEFGAVVFIYAISLFPFGVLSILIGGYPGSPALRVSRFRNVWLRRVYASYYFLCALGLPALVMVVHGLWVETEHAGSVMTNPLWGYVLMLSMFGAMATLLLGWILAFEYGINIVMWFLKRKAAKEQQA